MQALTSKDCKKKKNAFENLEIPMVRGKGKTSIVKKSKRKFLEESNTQVASPFSLAFLVWFVGVIGLNGTVRILNGIGVTD
ncbi:hypothetical protein U1Q18_017397 [Sarracenia purpurea var. burkii]